MKDQLEIQYENELAFIRRLGSEFAKERPKIADRLLIDEQTGSSQDPHVERLIEAFSFLTARIRVKLEDQFPELTDALLGMLYPHYLAPVPSMAIVQFEPDPAQGLLSAGHIIPRHSSLYSRPVKGQPCKFRTCYPVTLWPMSVKEASYEASPFPRDIVPPPVSRNAGALIQLKLQATGEDPFCKLKMDRMRFFLHGNERTIHTVYESLFTRVTSVVLRSGKEKSRDIVLSPDCLKPVGFERDEGTLPYGPQSFVGYRLLTEYFTFADKFLFVDLDIGKAIEADLGDGANFDRDLQILIYLDRPNDLLLGQVDVETFKLGCCPIVNLFKQSAEPINLTEMKSEYLIIPDVRHPSAYEVYSVDEVESVNPSTGESLTYRPFYSTAHDSDHLDEAAHWYAHRRPTVRQDDEGSDVFLSLVDLDFKLVKPTADVLTMKTTCTNRDLPGALRSTGGEQWQFELQGQAPLKRITPIVLPTASFRFPDDETRWRLISHLGLNHLSITGGEDGAEALREILRLYDVGNSRVNAQHIEGVVSVTSRRTAAPVRDGTMNGFCRGVEVTIELDEDRFLGSGVYLFASVLERFMGLYTSINSFTRVVARTRQREEVLQRWPARSGDRILV